MTSSKEPPRQRSRRAKGPRPQFFEDPNTHKLLAIITALASELAVVKERLDTHERVAAAGQIATPQSIEAYEPDQIAEDKRELWRQGFLSRVFRVLEVDAEGASVPQSEREFAAVIADFSKPE